jgi:hypothetical protein
LESAQLRRLWYCECEKNFRGEWDECAYRVADKRRKTRKKQCRRAHWTARNRNVKCNVRGLGFLGSNSHAQQEVRWGEELRTCEAHTQPYGKISTILSRYWVGSTLAGPRGSDHWANPWASRLNTLMISGDITHKSREFEPLPAIAGALEITMVMYQCGGKNSKSLESGAPCLTRSWHRKLHVRADQSGHRVPFSLPHSRDI